MHREHLTRPVTDLEYSLVTVSMSVTSSNERYIFCRLNVANYMKNKLLLLLRHKSVALGIVYMY